MGYPRCRNQPLASDAVTVSNALASAARRLGATVFSRESLTLEHTAHRWHADAKPAFLLRARAELLSGHIGLGLDLLGDAVAGCRVEPRLAAPSPLFEKMSRIFWRKSVEYACMP